MELNQIYRPIKEELKSMEEVLETSLMKSKNQSILRMSSFLLESPGKRIRPALAILSAKAALNRQSAVLSRHLIKIASAIELIHMASLVHDDVIDHSQLRHNKPTINFKWGEDVSITLGGYLYSVAFELISQCSNMDILQCITFATKAMCEGELFQVCERDNLDLLKKRYIIIIKKKTATLFAASCQAGTLISDCQKNLRSTRRVRNALKEYGFNFGVAFQISDDYLDIVGEEAKIGKAPGQDIRAGEMTLPILNLWESLPCKERKELEALLVSNKGKETLPIIKERLFDSGAAAKTRASASSFINLAKGKINMLPYSPYKESLLNLADFIIENGFNGSPRY